MKRIFNQIIAIVFLSLIIIGCNDTQESELDNNQNKPEKPTPKKDTVNDKPKQPKIDEYNEEKVDLGLSKEDEKFLLMVEKFPFGTNFKKIHDELGIKGIRPEGGMDELAAQGLTESKMKKVLMNKNVDVEFNFKNDSLYSFYYSFTENDFNKGEKLFKGLKQFYNKKLGTAEIPPAEEETRHIRTCLWREKAPYGVLSYNVNTGLISWGFQNTKP